MPVLRAILVLTEIYLYIIQYIIILFWKKVLKLNVNLALVRMMSDDKAVEHMLK